MSHQPSTLDQIKTTATNTVNSLQSSAAKETDPNYNPENDPENFAKDGGGNKIRKGGLKDKLDEAANGNGTPLREGKEEGGAGILDTVKSYIPGIASTKTKDVEREGEIERKMEEERRTGEPPRRPEHDVQVEQFLRGQYHSKSGDGMPDVGGV